MPAHNPFRCSFAAMAFNGTNTVLLDTGSYPGFAKIQNATFTWNGTDWTQAAPASSPIPKRTDFGLAYDGYNVVMFGGREQTNGPCQDTWSYNGTTWSKLNPTTKPFARWQHELAFLSTPLRTFMFGGTTMLDLTNETWVWDGYLTNWTLANSTLNPSARTGHALAGGSTAGALFGGQNQADLLGDTWTFNGTQWTLRTPTTPPSARTNASMVWDSTNSLWVLFGGSNGYDVNNETWTLNSAGTAWTKRAPATAPSPRQGAQMSFDSTAGLTVLTGGFNGYENLNDTWTFNGSTFAWTQV